MLFINLILVILATMIAIMGVFGETFSSTPAPFLKRITKRGWMLIAMLGAALFFSMVKEVMLDRENAKLEATNKKLLGNLESQKRQISDLQAKLNDRIQQQTKTIVQEFKAKNSPKTLEGLWMTEGDVTHHGPHITLKIEARDGNEFSASVNDSTILSLNGKMIGEATGEFEISTIALAGTKNARAVPLANGILAAKNLDGEPYLTWQLTDVKPTAKDQWPTKAALHKTPATVE